MDEPGDESEYSIVVDHTKTKPKPPGGSKQNNEVILLKSPDDIQGKSPGGNRRGVEKFPPYATSRKTTPPPGETGVQSPSRREFPSNPCSDHVPLAMSKTPIGSPTSSPMQSRRTTPQRDFSPPDGPLGVYAEINVKRKSSLTELAIPSHTHRADDGGSGSVQKSPMVQRKLAKKAPPPLKAKPKPDMYSVVQKKPPAGGSEEQLPLMGAGLERDAEEEESGVGGVYAQVQKKPKGGAEGRGSTPTPKPPAALARDEEGERGGDSTYAVVQKPKKILMATRSADDQVPITASGTLSKQGKLEQDTEEEGGDHLYAQVNAPKGKKSTPKKFSVPRYDHLTQYDHLPSDQILDEEGMEPASPQQPEPEAKSMYAVVMPKKKPPPPTAEVGRVGPSKGRVGHKRRCSHKRGGETRGRAYGMQV